MPKVKKLGVILEPTKNLFEKRAVLNPGVWQDEKHIHIFYRAMNDDGVSSIGYAKLKGPTEIIERWDKPILSPEYDYESRGVEDPRIVKIDGTFYMTYVAHDGKNAITACATSKSLKKFTKKGIISPQITYKDAETLFGESKLKDQYYLFSAFYREAAGEDVLIWHKDVVPFPKKIDGKFAMLQRILPDIQIFFFKDFAELSTDYWKDYLSHLSEYVVLENKHWFETRHVGGGAPPIETKDGWLAIIHAVEETNKGRAYRAGAMLLDINDPRKVIGKLHQPLFSPTEPWEVGNTKNFEGEVANVVFPTGTAVFGDDLYMYYGATDKRICVASVKISELLNDLQNPSLGHQHAENQ